MRSRSSQDRAAWGKWLSDSEYLGEQHCCKLIACADASLDASASTCSDGQRLGSCFGKQLSQCWMESPVSRTRRGKAEWGKSGSSTLTYRSLNPSMWVIPEPVRWGHSCSQTTVPPNLPAMKTGCLQSFYVKKKIVKYRTVIPQQPPTETVQDCLESTSYAQGCIWRGNLLNRVTLRLARKEDHAVVY